MKSVLLDEQGCTVDGKWRLAPVEPDQPMIDAARDKYMAWHYACGKEDVPLYYTPSDHFRAMIAASPAPVLAEAVPADWRSIVSEFICEAEQTYCPDSMCKYPNYLCCREDMKNLVQQAKALLQSSAATDNRIAELEAENQTLRADAERYRWWGSNMFRNAAMVAKTLASVSCGAELDAAIDAAKGGSG